MAWQAEVVGKLSVMRSVNAETHDYRNYNLCARYNLIIKKRKETKHTAVSNTCHSFFYWWAF